MHPKVVTLHRGSFDQIDFGEMPAPTRDFSPVREAAHIDLPLVAPARPLHAPQPQTRGWPRPAPMRFIDKAAGDAAHSQRVHTERQRELMQSAHAAGHDVGLVEGYWRGFKHGCLAGIVIGALLGGLVIGLRAGLLL